MSFINNISLRFIENSTFHTNSSGFQKYSKITAIALAIFASIGAIIYCVNRFLKKKKVEKSKDQNIPDQNNPLQNDQLNQKQNEEIKVKDKAKDQNIPIPKSKIPSNQDADKNLTNPIKGNQSKPQDPIITPQDQPILPIKINKTPAKDKANLDQKLTKPIEKKEQLKKIQRDPMFEQFDQVMVNFRNKIFSDPNFSTVDAFNKLNKSQCLTLLNELIEKFEKKHKLQKHFGYKTSVDHYYSFASNGESTPDRKYKSLAGIRNLIEYGPLIIDQLKKTHFLGGLHHYAQNEGLNLFHYYTGNQVDLDIEIDSKEIEKIKEIEKKNSHFLNDDKIAIQIAKKQIVIFGNNLNIKNDGKELTSERVTQMLPLRKLDISYPIHDAGQEHHDRSNHGIWIRKPPGQLKKYYINVPNFEIVFLAVLKLPYMVAEAVSIEKQRNKTISDEFFNNFYEKGLSDLCFNAKVQTFDDFFTEMKSECYQEEVSVEEIALKKVENDSDKKIQAEYIGEGSLSKILTTVKEITDIVDNDIETWVKNNFDHCKDKLIELDLWEKVFYQQNPGCEYFLLNQNTLEVFMKESLRYFYKL